MNEKSWSYKTVYLGLAIFSGLLPGCVTHVQYPQPAPVYAPAPPVVQPAPEYIPPAPAQPPVEYAPPVPAPAPVYVPEPAPAPQVVVEIHTESDFYQPLQPYGRWLDVPGYGRCWTPAGVDPDWRPYTDGRWQRTDAGWYWVSDEPWGWATCHYGRWRRDDNFGWVWIPQTQWAPAWVAWREGGGYTGWAPLPPEARVRPDGTFDDRNANIDPRSFAYVEQRRMLEPQRHQTVIANNTTIINKTVNITKIVVVNKTIINEGPRPDVVAQATGRKVDVMPARTLRTRQEAPAVAEHQRQTPGAERNKTPTLPATHNPISTPVTREPGARPNGPVITGPTAVQPVVGRPHEPGVSNEGRTTATNTVFRPTSGPTIPVPTSTQPSLLKPEPGQPSRQPAPGEIRQAPPVTNLPANHGPSVAKPGIQTGPVKPEPGQPPRQNVPSPIKPGQNVPSNPAPIPGHETGKPGTPAPTNQQKRELDQKQKVAAKHRLEGDKPHSQSSTNAPAPVH